MQTKHFNYFDDYKNLIFDCSRCHWKGTFEQGSVETYDDLMDCACPQCDVFQAPILAEVMYPTTEELVANADRPGVGDWIVMAEKAIELYEEEKLSRAGDEKLTQETETDAVSRKLAAAESALEVAAQDDLGGGEVEPALQMRLFAKPDEKRSGPVVTLRAHAPMRPVPGVPGVAWERTESGTCLVMNADPAFDNLPAEMRSDIIRRLMHCCEAPQHYLRVSAMRDEFSTDPAKLAERAKAETMRRQSDGRPSAEKDFQYGPELPDIDAEEFSLIFDYSDDRSKYFVLHGKRIVLSGPAANDPKDCMTDQPLGGQFIEIAKKLKTRYGQKLIDLVPTQKAGSMLMDLWGWALKREYGRKIVRQGLGVSQF
jgi:hypothetical protein